MGRLSVADQIKNANNAKVIEDIQTTTGVEPIDTSAYNSLTEMVLEYYSMDKQRKSLASMTEEKRSQIIDTMQNLKMNSLTVNGVKCTLGSTEKKSIDQEKLLKFCKKISRKLKIKGLVKKVEVVDLDVLEDLTYKREIDPEEIEQFTTRSFSNVLRISGKAK